MWELGLRTGAELSWSWAIRISFHKFQTTQTLSSSLLKLSIEQQYQKSLNKPSIVIRQTQENPDVCRSEGSRPVIYWINLFCIHLYIVVGHNMNNKGHWFQQKLRFVEFAYNWCSLSTCNVILKCCSCSSLVLEYIRMSSMNTMTKKSRYSRKTLFIRSINVVGALVRPTDKTRNS